MAQWNWSCHTGNTHSVQGVASEKYGAEISQSRDASTLAVSAAQERCC